VTILTNVFQECATVIGMDVPNAVYSSTEREHIELGVVANTMAKRISRAYEWELLKTVATYTGDDSTTAFAFPTDFDRMPKKQKLYASDFATALTPVPDADRWLEIEVASVSSVTRRWIKIGGQILIKPAMATAVTAKHYYQSNLIVDPVSGSNKVAFTLDTDTFRLNEELLKLGVIWQWKSNKGHAYAEDMASYEELLDHLITVDKGSRLLRVGAVRMPKDVTVAYPGTLGP
jgi:hypothetical protein